MHVDVRIGESVLCQIFVDVINVWPLLYIYIYIYIYIYCINHVHDVNLCIDLVNTITFLYMYVLQNLFLGMLFIAYTEVK